jgi:predicted Zn-dependent protease
VTPEQRLRAFRALVEKSPDDAFARYSLAMGLRAAGRHEEAAGEFAELARRHPGYVPTYLMWGQVLEGLGRTDQARRAYQDGAAAAREARNDHALSELTQAAEALKGT